jgi:hypothetical protein
MHQADLCWLLCSPEMGAKVNSLDMMGLDSVCDNALGKQIEQVPSGGESAEGKHSGGEIEKVGHFGPPLYSVDHFTQAGRDVKLGPPLVKV